MRQLQTPLLLLAAVLVATNCARQASGVQGIPPTGAAKPFTQALASATANGPTETQELATAGASGGASSKSADLGDPVQVGSDPEGDGHSATPAETHPETGFGPEPGSNQEFGMVNLLAPVARDNSRPTTTNGGTLATLRFGLISVGQGLSAEVVTRVLRQNWGRMRACYEMSLAQAPKLGGHLKLLFDIDPDGSVKSPRITDSNLDAPQLNKCLISDLGRLAFPKPDADLVPVSLPITLVPRVSTKRATAPAPAGSR